MPAVQLADIRAAIVANIQAANLPALTAGKKWNIQPYFLSTLTTPLIALKADPIEYDMAMNGGLDKVSFCCYALIGSGGVDIAMQKTIDRLMDPRSASSLKQAVEKPDFQGRATLGGLVSQVVVRACNGQKEYEARGGNIVLGTDFTIEVWT